MNVREHINNEEGSALITVLIIVVIISLFILGILGAVYVQVAFIQRDINEVKATYKAEEGVYRLLESISDQQVTEMDTTIFVQDSSGVQLSLRPFGGVYKINSDVNSGSKNITLTVVAGAKAPPVFSNAVVVGDTTSALNVTGSTSIRGDVVSGEGGVEKSSFKGFPFRGTFDGESYRVGKDFPFPGFDYRLFERFIDSTDDLFEKRNDRGAVVINNKRELLNRSFFPDTVFYTDSLIIEENEELELPPNKTLVVDGNIKVEGLLKLGMFAQVISLDSLVVSGAIKGTGFIAFAKSLLEVGGESEASGQFISSGRIKVNGSGYLQYPSTLYTNMQSFDGNEPEVIDIADQAQVDGTIIYPVENSITTRELFRVKIEQSATVRGSIYTLSQTELEGDILGTVATNQFYFYESPTVYINWLKDISIDVEERPENYIMPIGFSDTTRFGIQDWIINREAP